MESHIIHVPRRNWLKFRELIVSEQIRTQKSIPKLARDIITRAHYTKGSNGTDEVLEILFSLVRAALAEERGRDLTPSQFFKPGGETQR